jgi:hypothetical protein
MGGEMVKSFDEQVKRELPKSSHALRQEELDFLRLLEFRAKLAA